MMPNSMLFFFCGALPPLYPGVRPEITSFHFLDMAAENLTEHELASLHEIREYIDIQNIKKLLKEQRIDERGAMTEKELDDALVSGEGLPEIVLNFFAEIILEVELLT